MKSREARMFRFGIKTEFQAYIYIHLWQQAVTDASREKSERGCMSVIKYYVSFSYFIINIQSISFLLKFRQTSNGELESYRI